MQYDAGRARDLPAVGSEKPVPGDASSEMRSACRRTPGSPAVTHRRRAGSSASVAPGRPAMSSGSRARSGCGAGERGGVQRRGCAPAPLGPAQASFSTPRWGSRPPAPSPRSDRRALELERMLGRRRDRGEVGSAPDRLDGGAGDADVAPPEFRGAAPGLAEARRAAAADAAGAALYPVARPAGALRRRGAPARLEIAARAASARQLPPPPDLLSASCRASPPASWPERGRSRGDDRHRARDDAAVVAPADRRPKPRLASAAAGSWMWRTARRRRRPASARRSAGRCAARTAACRSRQRSTPGTLRRPRTAGASSTAPGSREPSIARAGVALTSADGARQPGRGLAQRGGS